MRLRIDFGDNGARKEVIWWGYIEDFPTCFIYQGQRWEWIVYADDPKKQYDKILTYEHMSRDDVRWNTCQDFEYLFTHSVKDVCECGSTYTSFPAFHMFYCPMWRPQ